jgi:hypothetical protein
MRNQIYKLIVFAPLLLFSCNRHKANIPPRNADNYKLVKGPERCFTAVYQKDSAFLNYKTAPDGKIQGRLIIKYGELEPLAMEKEFYHGEITGKFKKDTLFANYVFANGDGKTIYRNPIALLRRNDKLLLGFGVIINYVGVTWFRDHREINFNRGRFQFVPAECNN